MAIYATQPESTFTPCPEGLHHAVCVDVVDMGMKKGLYGEKHKIRIVWQVDQVDPDTDRRFDVAAFFTLSLHEKSNLRKTLEGWRSKKLTDVDLAPPGFDVEKLVGANCQLHVVHTLKDDGRVYANVAAVVPPPKNVPKLLPVNYIRAKDRATGTNGHGPSGPPPIDEIPF